MEIAEAQALPRHGVDIGRADTAPMNAKVGITEVVGHDQQNVWPRVAIGTLAMHPCGLEHTGESHEQREPPSNIRLHLNTVLNQKVDNQSTSYCPHEYKGERINSGDLRGLEPFLVTVCTGVLCH